MTLDYIHIAHPERSVREIFATYGFMRDHISDHVNQLMEGLLHDEGIRVSERFVPQVSFIDRVEALIVPLTSYPSELDVL